MFPMPANEPPAPPPLLVEESDELFQRPSRGTWMMIVALLIAKIGGLIVIFAVDPSEMAALFAFVSTWIWFVVLGVLLGGPVSYWWRLRRMRRKRTALQRAEWMIDTDDPSARRVRPTGQDEGYFPTHL
jgi:hypothetical protein